MNNNSVTINSVFFQRRLNKNKVKSASEKKSILKKIKSMRLFDYSIDLDLDNDFNRQIMQDLNR